MAGKVGAAGNPKAALRKQILAARDALTPAARRELSARITPQLLTLDAYRNAVDAARKADAFDELFVGLALVIMLAAIAAWQMKSKRPVGARK